MIRKVAVGGGACGDFMADAMQNSDCFVTSDLKYHEMLDAAEEKPSTLPPRFSIAAS